MSIITVTNQKGGVGKTTTAAALNAGLTRRGFKTLLIDLDPQENLTYTMDATGAEYSSLDLLTGAVSITQAITKTDQGDIVAAAPGLTNAPTTLTSIGKEYKLLEALEPVKKNYDFIIIDTPPALSVLTINALTACSGGVIIPAQADIFSLQGIGQLIQTIQTVKKYCNSSLFIKGLLLTRYNARTVISQALKEMLEETAAALNTKVFGSKIRECTALKEAAAEKQSIFNYAPKSNAAKDYNAFIDELLEEE